MWLLAGFFRWLSNCYETFRMKRFLRRLKIADLHPTIRRLDE